MLVKYTVNDRCSIDIEVPDVKTAFSFLSYSDSVFGTKCCGNCGNSNLSFLHRTPQGYDYYSVKCNDCKHELKFGQQKDSGRLFPKGWEEPYYGGDEDGEKPARRDRTPDDEQADERETVGAGSNGNGRKRGGDGIPF